MIGCLGSGNQTWEEDENTARTSCVSFQGKNRASEKKRQEVLMHKEPKQHGDHAKRY
jgi:hypothetical protein